MEDYILKYNGSGKDGAFSGEVTVKHPTSTEEAIQVYGEIVCLGKIIQAVKVDQQRICRTYGEDVAGAQEAMNVFVPGIGRARTQSGPKAELAKLLNGMTSEEVDEVLAKARAKAEGNLSATNGMDESEG